MSAAVPVDYGIQTINVRQASRVLQIVWQDDTHDDLAFSLLRARCACASCRRAAMHEPGRARQPDYRDVTVIDVRPVGYYAIQLVFSDGHDRGIFPFRYLRELGGADVVGGGERAVGGR